MEVVAGCQHPKLRAIKILLEWFHQARTTNSPITGPILKEKAFEIAGQLSINEFRALSTETHIFRLHRYPTYKAI